MTIELADAARSGDDAAFALLIQENLAGMRAVAVATLGQVDEADDAVQDAVLTAMRKLPELRDPAAAGPWLRSIVRNNCRMLVRSRRTVPVADPEPLLSADPAPGPDDLLDRADTRDWVRQAVGTLPDPVREVTVLRYFSAHSSYAQIADLCAVPVDTVRSRLRDGRRTLERVLRESATSAHADTDAGVTATRHEAEAALAAGERGAFAEVLRDRFHPDASVVLSGKLTGETGVLLDLMDYTYGAGVRVRLRDVAASRDLMIWETDFVNPPGHPEHCPPGLIWLHSLREGRTQRLRLAYRLTPVAQAAA